MYFNILSVGQVVNIAVSLSCKQNYKKPATTFFHSCDPDTKLLVFMRSHCFVSLLPLFSILLVCLLYTDLAHYSGVILGFGQVAKTRKK